LIHVLTIKKRLQSLIAHAKKVCTTRTTITMLYHAENIASKAGSDQGCEKTVLAAGQLFAETHVWPGCSNGMLPKWTTERSSSVLSLEAEHAAKQKSSQQKARQTHRAS
jgi:hypothetical protein